MKSKLVLRQLFLPSIILLAASSAHSASATWNLNNAGNWATGGNWNPAAAPGATSGTTNTDTAIFGNIISADRIVTVDTGRNISVIDFNANNFKYTLSGGSLILSSGGTIKTSGAGSTHNADTISSPITLANANASTSGTLSILGLSTNAERGLVVSGGTTGAATAGTSTLTLGGTTVSNTGTQQNKITGDIANGLGGGTLAVEKTGTGLWVLEGAKTFSGGLTVREGDLRLAGNAAAAGSGPITLGDTTGTANATLGINSSIAPTNALTVATGSSGIKTLNTANVTSPGYNGAITLNDALTISVTTSSTQNTNFTLGGASGISLNANTLTLSIAPTGSNTITNTITVNKAVSGTGAIAIVGTGTNANATRVVALNGTNSYTGGTTVGATGTDRPLTVDVSGNQSAANGGWTINSFSTVNFQSGSTIVLASGNNVTLSNGGSGDKTLIVAGTVTTGNFGNLNVYGRSTLTLDSGANWTQNGGTIDIQPKNSGTNAVMNVNSGASFTYAGVNNINLAKSSSVGNGSATLNLSGGTFTTGRGFSNSLAGTGSGTTNLNFSSGGTLKLSANITSLITEGATPFNVTTGTGGGVIDTNGFSTAIGVGVSGTGGLTKAGTGSLLLSGTNTYNGATTVSAGTLYVTGSLSNSAVTVEANGTIGRNDNTLGGGNLASGLTIEIGGNLDLTGATLGSNSTGILSLTGGSLTLGNLTFQDLVGWDWANAAAGTYELIDGTFTIDWGSTAYLDAGSAYDFGNGKKGYFESGSLNVVIIPEPGAALLGGLGLLALLRRRR